MSPSSIVQLRDIDMSAVANGAEILAAVARRTHSAAFALHTCALVNGESVIIAPFQSASLNCSTPVEAPYWKQVPSAVTLYGQSFLAGFVFRPKLDGLGPGQTAI